MSRPQQPGVVFKLVRDNTAIAAKIGEDVLAEWIEDVAEDGLTAANQTIPIETGAMAASGFTEVDRSGGTVTGQIGYDTPYAAHQHEDPTLHHDPGRRDHWLSKTVEENADRWHAYLVTLAARRFHD